MKLKFSFIQLFQDRQNLIALVCEPSSPFEHGVSPIQVLLESYSSGGASLVNYAAWIAEALSRIDAVLSGELSSADWMTDLAIADIEPETVRISLETFPDRKTHSQTMKTAELRAVLISVQQFILDEPHVGAEMEFEISDI